MTEPQLEQIIMFCPGCKTILFSYYDSDIGIVGEICPFFTEDPVFNSINENLFNECHCDEDYIYLDESEVSINQLIDEVQKTKEELK